MKALTLVGAASCALAEEPAQFVGGHRTEMESWQNSHHACDVEGDRNHGVGDFTNSHFEHLDVITTFSRSGGKFMVRTEGPDGALYDYEIAYTFGVYPLQQYLIAFPGER